MEGAADEELHWGLYTVDRVPKPYFQKALVCTSRSYTDYEVPAMCNWEEYDDEVYNCTNHLLLCPKPLVGCGTLDKFACYDAAAYSCKNGQLEPLH
jgi:hypothetical protein